MKPIEAFGFPATLTILMVVAFVGSERIFEKEIMLEMEEVKEDTQRFAEHPLTNMSADDMTKLCEDAVEKTYIRWENENKTESRSVSNRVYRMKKVRREKKDEKEYETDVAVRCHTVPVVHLCLGNSDEKMRMIFSYEFKKLSVKSVKPVPEPSSKFEDNHLFKLEDDLLSTLCSIALTSAFKQETLGKPQVFEIEFLPQSKKQNEIDVAIDCSLGLLQPISLYLRYRYLNMINQMEVIYVKKEFKNLTFEAKRFR